MLAEGQNFLWQECRLFNLLFYSTPSARFPVTSLYSRLQPPCCGCRFFPPWITLSSCESREQGWIKGESLQKQFHSIVINPFVFVLSTLYLRFFCDTPDVLMINQKLLSSFILFPVPKIQKRTTFFFILNFPILHFPYVASQGNTQFWFDLELF